MHLPDSPPSAGHWILERTVLPQHTDHAGVMWHGAYLAWLEEARVEALAAAGLSYADLSRRGLELPVVSLTIEYRQALQHGDRVRLLSRVLPRRGVKLSWHCRFVCPDGSPAAEASVDLVPVEFAGNPLRRRLVRRLPADLEEAVSALIAGPVTVAL